MRVVINERDTPHTGRWMMGMTQAIGEWSDVVRTGRAPGADAARWFADMEERAMAGMFYCTITAFTVSGRKP
jgi:hypothetical protein